MFRNFSNLLRIFKGIKENDDILWEILRQNFYFQARSKFFSTYRVCFSKCLCLNQFSKHFSVQQRYEVSMSTVWGSSASSRVEKLWLSLFLNPNYKNNNCCWSEILKKKFVFWTVQTRTIHGMVLYKLW